jgi:hypothetical protein
MSSPVWKRKLRSGNFATISVSQGRTSKREALPRQLEAAREVHQLGRPMAIAETVDSDGERGIVVAPPPTLQHTVDVGRHAGQRSVLWGAYEVETSHGLPLTTFDKITVSEHKPRGFWTHLPSKGLYFSWRQTRSHRRGRSAVRGYVSRLKVKPLRPFQEHPEPVYERYGEL